MCGVLRPLFSFYSSGGGRGRGGIMVFLNPRRREFRGLDEKRFLSSFFFLVWNKKENIWISGNRTISNEAIEQFPDPDYGPSFNQWKDNMNTSTLVESYYKDIPKVIRDQIRDLYAIDFEMFGYDKYLPFEKTENKPISLEKWTIWFSILKIWLDFGNQV